MTDRHGALIPYEDTWSTVGGNRFRRLSPPRRIQRKRAKGWRMPEGAVYVGRPTRWGNPYSVGSGIPQDCCEFACYEDEGCSCDGCMSPAKAVALYLADIADQCARDPGHADRWTAPLRGRDLACWCPLDQPCHADVLLELANSTLNDPVPAAVGSEK